MELSPWNSNGDPEAAQSASLGNIIQNLNKIPGLLMYYNTKSITHHDIMRLTYC